MPTGLSATAVSSSQINLAWNASTDNPGGSGVAGYRVYRNGSGVPLQPLTVGTGLSDTGLTAATTYTYRVSSVDNALNESALSTQAQATTQTSAEWLSPLNINDPAFDVPPFVLGVPSTWDFSPYVPAGSSNYRFDPLRTQPPAGLPIVVDIPNRRVSYSGGGTIGSYPGEGLDAITADSDWQTRIAGSNVVKYARLDTLAEIRAFQWEGSYGNDPLGLAPGAGNIRLVTAAGANCMEIFHAAGASPNDGMFFWWPLAPFAAPGNGKSVNDPAAGGAVTLRTWAPTDRGNQTPSFGNGWYTHPSVTGTHVDGNEFWVAWRTMRDPVRFTAPMVAVTNGGKFNFLSICAFSNSLQELVTYSGDQTVRVYRRQGGTTVELGAGQPGGVSPTWQWAANGTWDSIMYHMIPGRPGVNETLFEIYGAHAGETSWTLFMSLTFAAEAFDIVNGWQALILGVYNNGFAFPSSWTERHRDLVLYRGPTVPPCPQV